MTRTPGNTGDTSFWHSSGELLVGVTQIGLDSWWQSSGNGDQQIALIKIDVEGMEYDVLRSAEQLIASHKPLVVFEVRKGQPMAGFPDQPDQSWAAMDQFFLDHGYDLFANRHGRNSFDDGFKLERLERLKPTHLERNLADILAVPTNSVRHP